MGMIGVTATMHGITTATTVINLQKIPFAHVSTVDFRESVTLI